MISTATSHDEDTHLMLDAAAGDAAAYDKLYRKYFPMVVSFVAGLQVQPQTAEDVAQDVFARIWEHRARYQPSAAFRTYLFGCAKNVYCEHRVKTLREVSVRETAATAALLVAQEEDSPTVPLRQSIAHLPGRQKQVVEMIYLLDLSIGQAAERLRCSVHAIHQSLYLARRKLREFTVLPRL
jgi:RNA polymerase sigma-70 factor (ECF subfamily)